MAQLPGHVSHSQLTSWQRCGKSYQLKRLQGAPSVPAVWSFAGKAVHSCIEEINKAHATGVNLDLIATWRRCWDEEMQRELQFTSIPPEQWRVGGRVSKDKPNKEDLTWWFAEGERQCVAYQTWLRSSEWTIAMINDTPACEIEVNGDFGGVMVKGYLDAVLQHVDSGDLLMVDYKSGSKVPASPAQLAQYAATLRRTLGIDIAYGAYYMTRKGELTDPIGLARFTPELFDRQFGQFRTALEAGIFLPHPGDACFTCDVKSSCFAVGGTDAWLYDPDHPQYTHQKETA